MFADGYDLTQVPLLKRKQFLKQLIAGVKGNIVYSTHVVGNGDDYFREACRLGLEGIISKRADRPYYLGRSADWLKAKCQRRDEFVVGGYTDPAGSRIGFGSLLVGYHDDQHRLRYAGRVGTGFDTAALRQLIARLEKLEQDQSPFTDLARKPAMRAMRTGSSRDWSPRWSSPNGPPTVACAIRRFKVCEKTNPPTKSCSTGRRRSPHSAWSETANRMQMMSLHPQCVPKPLPNQNARPSRPVVAGVRITSPEKVLYPEQGITKLNLAQYYEQIAKWALPELVNRPLVLVRCPEGRQKECFYQKHPGARCYRSAPPNPRAREDAQREIPRGR